MSEEKPVPQDEEWLINGLRRGDAEAARVFCNQYGPLLQKVADRQLAAGLRRRVGPETICQSACLSFLRRAQAGEYQLDDSEGLWRLLCAITLTKVREKARYHRRKKRSLEREQSLTPAGSEENAFDPVDARQSPIEAVEFEDEFTVLLNGLSDEERQLVDLKLQQFTNEEAAAQMGCSERTVRRLLNRIKERLEVAFDLDPTS